MRIKHIAPEGWQRDERAALERLGHEIVEENPDAIIVKSVSQMEKGLAAYRKYPDALKIQYVWDVYSWVLNSPRKDEYDYNLYKRICLISDEVWVPSRAVQKSLWDFWNTPSFVMTSWAPQYPINCEIEDRGYALQALRKNPDKHMDWYEKACQETGIDYKVVWAKELSEEEYRPILAHSKFLVSAIYEMSTGGQFLTEGAMLGKPILASAGEYVGAVDYFGDTIAYYKDYEDLKRKMLQMSKGELKTNTKGAKKLVEQMTVENFAKKVDKRLKELWT